MDKCSCLNPEALSGVLKTIYLFLEGQNFRATCETFLSESRGMGYVELKKAIACILVLKPSVAEIVKVSHADPMKNKLQVQADWAHAMAAAVGSSSKNVNVFYGQPLCMNRPDSSLSSPDLCGTCSTREQCGKGGGLNVVETIDNTKNDIETHKILKKAVQDEIKIAPPPPPEHDAHHIIFKESPQVSVISPTEVMEIQDTVYPEQMYGLSSEAELAQHDMGGVYVADIIPAAPSETSSHPSILNEEDEVLISAEDFKSHASAASVVLGSTTRSVTGSAPGIATPSAGASATSSVPSAVHKTPSVAPSAGRSVNSASPSAIQKAPSVTSSGGRSVTSAPSGAIHTVPSVVPTVGSAIPNVPSAAHSAAFSTASSVPTVLQGASSATPSAVRSAASAAPTAAHSVLSAIPSVSPSIQSSHQPSVARSVTTAEGHPASLGYQASVKSVHPSATSLGTTREASLKSAYPQEKSLTVQSSVRFDIGGRLIDTNTSNVDTASMHDRNQQSILSTPSVTDVVSAVSAAPPEPSIVSSQIPSTITQPSGAISAVSEMQATSKMMTTKATVCELCSTKQVGLQIGNCVRKTTATEPDLAIRSTHTTTRSSSINFSVERSASTQSFRNQYALDYNKIKKELRSGCPSVRVMLLQALRWRITQSHDQDRNQIIADYARHDILSLHGTPSKYYKKLAEEFLCTTRKKLVQEHEESMARMINAMASLTLGRDYLCQDETLLTKVIIPLVMDTHPSKSQLSGNTKEYLLVALQKLSLRNNMRVIMIQNGLAEYIVSYLTTNHNTMTDYCLEYCLALFMNLCLHSETHARLKKKSRDVVKFMSDFLSADHDSCLSYLNGAMYSLFMDPDIRKEAKHGHLDSKISEKSKAVDDDIRLQMEVIMDILNTNKTVSPCGQCDCIDQDDEIDHLEPEIEDGDVVNGNPNGENLLSLYRPDTFLSEPSHIPLTCLCRPATPCKKITATEKCPHVDIDAELPQSPERDKDKKSKKSSSCFAMCRKSKPQNALDDDEKILASEECPRTDTVCCEPLEDESIPVREPSITRSASVQKSMASHVSICPSCKCLQNIETPLQCSSTRQPFTGEVSMDHSAISRQTSQLSRQGSALSRQGSALSRQGSALSRQGSALSRQGSAINGQPSEISGQPSAMSRQPSAMGRQASVMSRQASVTSRQSNAMLADAPVTVPSAHFPPELSRYSTRSFEGVGGEDQPEMPAVWATSAQQVNVSHPSIVTHVSTCMQCCATDLEQAPMASHISVIGEQDVEPEPDIESHTSRQGTCPASRTTSACSQPYVSLASESRTLSARLPPCSTAPSRAASVISEPRTSPPRQPACSATPSRVASVISEPRTSPPRQPACSAAPSRVASVIEPEESPPEELPPEELPPEESRRCSALPAGQSCTEPSPSQPNLAATSQGNLGATSQGDLETISPEKSEDEEEKRQKRCRSKCGKSPKSKPTDDDKSKGGRGGYVAPSFTRSVINNDGGGRSRYQLQNCDPCRISNVTCQPQNSCYMNSRAYCYDTTSQVCRNQYCSCPNPGQSSSQAVGKSSCSVTQGPQNRNRYMCECYNNMKQFVQNTDVSSCSTRCPKRSDGEGDPAEQLSTPERELRNLQQALIQTDNFCALDTSCIFNIDCECCDSVFQSRPKLSRTP